MKYFPTFIVLLSLIACQPATQQTQLKKASPQHRASKSGTRQLGEVIDVACRTGNPAEGFTWSEGPVWVPEGRYLLFSDVPENTVYKWKEGEGKSVYLQPSGFTAEPTREGESGSNGLTLDKNGQLILCQHGDRRLARMIASLDAQASEFETIADNFEGKRFNSPNDVVQASDGSYFFTDPPYGLPKGMEDPGKEIDFQGVYKVDPEGNVSLISDQMTRPNGIALSPDERTLYVANSDPKKAVWMAFSLDESGNSTGEQLFLDATEKADKANPGMPDGLKVDANGTIFATGPGGVWIISPEGKALGLVRTGHKTANCAPGRRRLSVYDSRRLPDANQAKG